VRSKLLLLLAVFVIGAANVGFFLNLRNLPDANYPFILIVINLNLVFLIVVSAVIFRKLIKVYLGKSQNKLRRKIANVLILYLFIPVLLLNLVSVVLILQSTKEYMSGRIRDLSKQALGIYTSLKEYEIKNLYEKRELMKHLPDEELRRLPFVRDLRREFCDYDLIETERSYILCLGDRVAVVKKEVSFKESFETFGKLASDLRSFVKAKDIITGIYVFLIVALGLIALLATVWLSMYFARFISEPIERLTSKAMEIARGNLDTRVEVEKTGDEIEKLSRAFREMKENLKKLYENLREEKEFFRKLLDALPVAILLRRGDGSLFVNKTFLNMFGSPGDLGEFLKEVKTNKNIRIEKLSREEGELYILEDITPIVLAERFRVWQDSVRRIAHEIKNPLTPIRLNLERILRNLEREEIDRERMKELVRIVLEEFNRINLLVSQFKSLSFEREVRPEKVSLRSVLEEIKKIYQNTGLEIEVSGERVVLADRNLLKEIFYNLVNNSLEHGAKRITVHLTQERLVYRDDGKGLREEEIEHIFEPFFSKNPKGFGIGMSIVKKIVEEHGWEVKVFPGEGFHLEIYFSSRKRTA